jgi:indole-3-glycerol phosphate synthase
VNLLEKIIAHSARRVDRLRRERPVEKLRESELYERIPRGLKALLEPPGPRRVAEVRFASPECGLRVPRGFDTAEEAVRWARVGVKNGARAVSVVAERNFHAGSWDHVSAVRAALPDVCLIGRDIYFDPYQLELARAHGVDAVTLWGAVTGARTAELAQAARALGLGVVVEALNAAQLESAQDARPDAVLAIARDVDAAAVVPTARALFEFPPGPTMFYEVATTEDLDASPIPDVWAAADLG